jgi:hypothetical protein
VAASGSGFMTDPTAATAAPGGSTPATTCSGTAVIAGQLAAIPPSRIWFTPTPATEPANNSVGDPVSYGATFVDSAHLTLDSPYQGTSGTHGWETAGITGWASQPYMMGILSWAFDLAAKAVATVSPTTASLSHSYSVAAANWIKTYGYWPAAKGMYYTVGGPDCKYPISDSNTLCTAGFAPDQARTLSAEAMRGLDLAYAYSQDKHQITHRYALQRDVGEAGHVSNRIGDMRVRWNLPRPDGRRSIHECSSTLGVARHRDSLEMAWAVIRR